MILEQIFTQRKFFVEFADKWQTSKVDNHLVDTRHFLSEVLIEFLWPHAAICMC